MKTNLEHLRALVNQLDEVANQINETLEDMSNNDENLTQHEFDLGEKMEFLKNDITEYQEQKGYI